MPGLRHLVEVSVLVVLLPVLAYSQSAAQDWSMLVQSVREGDTVHLKDRSRAQVRGSVLTITDSSLQLLVERAGHEWVGGADSEGVLIPSNDGATGEDDAIGSRVRISTGSAADVPGIGQGDRRGKQARIVGVIASQDQQTLTVRRDDGSTVAIPWVAVARVEHSVGRRSRWRGAGLGFLIGGGVGASVGFVDGIGCDSTKSFCVGGPAAAAIGGLVLGGAGGAVVGALIRPGERWEEAPPGWLDRGARGVR